MKLAIAGKGGVGKTTLAAGIARVVAARGGRVTAVDADADGNLADALGVPAGEVPRAIVSLRDVIMERTGAVGGGYGGYFKLNPYVDDIPEEYSVVHNGVRLLILGTVEPAGGCLCPEATFLRALMANLLFRPGETLILDMEAGLEHLGRASAQGVDAMIAVVEPGMRSVRTAQDVSRMARALGIPRVFAVCNRVRDAGEEGTLRRALGEIAVLGVLPYDEQLLLSDLEGRSPFERVSPFLDRVSSVYDALSRELGHAGAGGRP
ncbi:MAG: AAA family ATPase [Gemmatimonadetes bacterium]|nr:AAA family ATPase [Gemmatimonadota bacterium]